MKTPPSAVPDLVTQGFMDARHKILDVAAFLDRVTRHGQQNDFRIAALRQAIERLGATESSTEAIQILLSDPGEEPIPTAHTKGALGAFEAEGDQ